MKLYNYIRSKLEILSVLWNTNNIRWTMSITGGIAYIKFYTKNHIENDYCEVQ